FKTSLAVTPFVGAFAGSVAFMKTEADGSIFVPVDSRDRIVLAGRVNIGSIVGDLIDEVLVNRRFYAGGGGSIRGFGYQLVGPLDSMEQPTGGRSLAETALEARFRVSDTIGVVPFFDAGLVSLSSLPGENAKLRMAAGIGGRYYTAVGPLRLDIAIPLNSRPGIDKGFQFYISFGQAF
ncbi:MAG: BamA/TamA family outer membrane protein, partial [Rhodospirillaceae bacterium]